MDPEDGENRTLEEVPDEMDAFNDDTFGAGADAWDEEGHEQLAKLTEEELHGVQASNDFFDFNEADDDCLEPPGSETLNGDFADMKLEQNLGKNCTIL